MNNTNTANTPTTPDIPGYAWEIAECGIATYVACVFGDEGDEPGDCTLDLERAEDDDVTWWRWTESEAGEAGPARRTRREALDDAEEYASENDESLAGEDAEDMARRLLNERAGSPDPTGEWCVYWVTSSGGGSYVVERYSSEDAAQAACDLANMRLHAGNPGSQLLCGFEVRVLVDGQWEPVDED